jgi:FdrA protein
VNERQRVELRRGAYHDSVTLLQVSRAVAGVEGVLAAQVAMATELNVEVLTGMGFEVPANASPNDLVVAVRAADDDALAAADAALARALAGGGAGGAGGGAGGAGGAPQDAPPRTTGSAVRRTADPGLALVSVPGQHAFPEAMDALEAGLDVFLFSDNVPLEQEVRLKAEAARRDLLVMGPDCGTAVVSGVGLGFANVVRPGPVGLVAASGTGAQQVMSLLDAAGVGVRHCLGVGGRDLSDAVGGASARQALRMLDEDPGTELIVVVSKPPSPRVAAELEALARTLSTPVQFALLGPGQPDLTEAARGVVEALGQAWTPARSWSRPPAPLRGSVVLRAGYSGGTLCDEAMLIAADRLGPVASNIPLAGAPRATGTTPDVHPGPVMIDFGDDEFTRGRPHPMIDNSLRLQWLEAQAGWAAESGDGRVLLLDVVLGHGAHADPAAELAPAIAAARAVAAGGGGIDVVVALIGTEGDPQGLLRQAAALHQAGAHVHLSDADAASAAIELVLRAAKEDA